uniref:Synaptotagmin-like 1 n=1 Tax=Labrus bergylta TaxID=56723 RepID=A0A3Q3E6G8_9LABR
FFVFSEPLSFLWIFSPQNNVSHLTEEEQSSILKVLQRDLELQRLDEGRVRSETDPARLRSLTGVWFDEERSKRHRNRASVCTLVHATLRHRKTKSRGKFSVNAILVLNQWVFSLTLIGISNQLLLKNSSSTGSLQSGYMLRGIFGLVEVRGRILFSLVYDTQKEELQNRSDPYVKSYLLPDKSSQSKKKTSVKKKTVNPVYDQTLRYKVRKGELPSRTLNLSVWHAEPLGRNVFLGEVEAALGLWDWSCTQPLWQDLQPRVHLNPDSISSRGTIVLSIKFIPDGYEGELHIWLREAHGLLSNKGGAIDSFVRSFILPDASRQSGQKTRMTKRSISPTYNHNYEACAELTVWQIRLSCGTGESELWEDVSWMDSTVEEVAVWTSMITNPNHWIDATLPIRTTSHTDQSDTHTLCTHTHMIHSICFYNELNARTLSTKCT